jgi:hypothetical protein
MPRGIKVLPVCMPPDYFRSARAITKYALLDMAWNFALRCSDGTVIDAWRVFCEERDATRLARK